MKRSSSQRWNLSQFWVVIVLMLFTQACAAQNTGEPAPTPTVSQAHYAVAEIAKPTHTATPTATATPLPTLTPTLTPQAVAQAVIVDSSTVSDSPQVNNEAAPANTSGGKYILVDLSEQHMYVYEGETLAFSFIASTGMHNATRTGTFSVLDKIPNAYGATWNIWMPNWLGIYWAGSLENGIHALPILSNGATLWAGFLGTPISYGCVVLDTQDSLTLYDWAEVGVPVEIRW